MHLGDEPLAAPRLGTVPFRRWRGTAGGVVAKNRIKPTFSTPDVGGCVDLIDKAWKIGGDVFESFVIHQIDGLDLEGSS